jgi:release factor glutamine methyltransferase
VGALFCALRKRLKGTVDVITLHPPYVAKDEVADLPDEVRAWEPVDTLTDHSDDGLGLVRRAVEESPTWLRKDGWLLMETDPDRARDVKRVYEGGGFRDIASTKGGDLKVTRVIVGRRPR